MLAISSRQMPSHARAVSRHSRMNLRSSALSEKLSERASAALASSIFAATVARVDLAIAPISRSSPPPPPSRSRVMGAAPSSP